MEYNSPAVYPIFDLLVGKMDCRTGLLGRFGKRICPKYSKYNKLALGEVTERPKVRHWKCRVGVKPHRGFESRPLRFQSLFSTQRIVMNNVATRIWSKLASFSIWQYSRLIPAKCHGQMYCRFHLATFVVQAARLYVQAVRLYVQAVRLYVQAGRPHHDSPTSNGSTPVARLTSAAKSLKASPPSIPIAFTPCLPASPDCPVSLVLVI